jgi:hypothetical protein
MSQGQDLMGGPYICAAFFCEKVLKEADGVISAIRIIDRFNIRGDSPEMAKSTLLFNAFISLKSGEYRGRAEISIQPTTPSGKALPKITFPVNFEGDSDRGVGIAAPIQLAVDEEGPYWFDVRLGEQPITRMPLRVVYQRNPSTGSGSSR